MTMEIENKQLRLSSIRKSIFELCEKEEQALYGADLALKTKEYSHLQTCVTKLLAVEDQRKILFNEAKSLEEDIEKTNIDIIL